MTAKTSPDKVAECRRLRVECRLSIDEISAKTGVPKGTLFPFLKDIPLTDKERSERRAAGSALGRSRIAEMVSKKGMESPYFPVILKRVKTTDQRGAIAEAAVIFRLKVWGLAPHLPLCAGGKSDIAVYVPDTGRLLRIQVKCVRRKKWGMPSASLRARAGGRISVRYEDDAFDFFVGYDLREDVCYVMSMAELVSKKSGVTVNKDGAERWDKLIAP